MTDHLQIGLLHLLWSLVAGEALDAAQEEPKPGRGGLIDPVDFVRDQQCNSPQPFSGLQFSSQVSTSGSERTSTPVVAQS